MGRRVGGTAGPSWCGPAATVMLGPSWLPPEPAEPPGPGTERGPAAAPPHMPGPVLSWNRGVAVSSVVPDPSSLPRAHRDAPSPRPPRRTPDLTLLHQQPHRHTRHSGLRSRSTDPVMRGPAGPASLCLPPLAGPRLSRRPPGGIPPQYLMSPWVPEG